MSKPSFFIYLAVMAGITYLIRMLPLVLIKKKITNRFILSLLHYIPYAVLSAMTIPAVFFVTDHIVAAIVGVAVALLLAFKTKSLVLVALGATLGVLISEIFITLI